MEKSYDLRNKIKFYTHCFNYPRIVQVLIVLIKYKQTKGELLVKFLYFKSYTTR